MKNKYKFLGFLGLLPFFAAAQLTNNGATIVIEPGATLVVEGAITNNATSTITNNGTIQVDGNFINAGTLSSTGTNSDIQFTGNAEQLFDPGTNATVEKVTINQDVATTGDVVLQNPLTITGELVLTQGKLDIGANDLNIGTGVVPTGTSSSYVKADGDGMLVKTFDATGIFNYPVGDDSEYTPLEANVTAGATGTMGVNIDIGKDANLPNDANNDNRNATEYVARSWNVTENMDPAFAASLKGTYVAGDVVQTNGSSLIRAAYFDGVDWDYSETDETASSEVSLDIDGSGTLTGSNTFGKSMVNVILGGAYDDVANEMRTDLNGGATGILATNALSSPYTTTLNTDFTVDAAFFNAHPDIVDWVKIELRTGASSATATNIVKSRSAFVDKDGNLLDLNGTVTDNVLFFKNAPRNSYIAIRHRNHLGVMLNTEKTIFGQTPMADFTSETTFGTNAQRAFDATVMMWHGDPASDGNLDYDGTGINDLASLQNQILTHPSNTGFGGAQLGRLLTDVYSDADLNLDGNLDYDGVGQNELAILQNIILNHTNNTGFGGAQLGRLITQELPEE